MVYSCQGCREPQIASPHMRFSTPPRPALSMAPDNDVSQLPDNQGSGSLSAAKLLPLAIIIAAAVLIVSMGWHHELSLEALVRHRATLDDLIHRNFPAALGSFIGIYIIAVALSLPGAVFLTVAGGILFGWLIGGWAAILAATTGATILFLIARSALSDYV